VLRATPQRPALQVGAPLVTITDLAGFAAETYAEWVDAWCRASLAAWGVPASVAAARSPMASGNEHPD
jgi:hypothetical protein